MILDTNVYTALRRGEMTAVEMVNNAKDVCLPFCVVAELKFGFVNGTKRATNERFLTDFLALPHVDVLYPNIETISTYAELATYCRNRGRSLSPNDIWIAALASDGGQRLITYDKDFEVFGEVFGDRLAILEH